MKHSDHWNLTGWHGEQRDFQNNEKTMEHSDHWIMTGWHGKQWDFQNNENFRIFIVLKISLFFNAIQWSDCSIVVALF
jgi:hypothetical protein